MLCKIKRYLGLIWGCYGLNDWVGEREEHQQFELLVWLVMPNKKENEIKKE